MMDRESLQKRRLCHVTSVMVCSLFWVSWPLKTGLIGCPEMRVTNYHCMLRNNPEECGSYVSIWWQRPWYGWALSGWERSGSAQFSSVLDTRIWDNLVYLSAKCTERNTVLRSSKYGNDSWRLGNQLGATCYFILLRMGSTCFWHYYAHHQELVTMLLNYHIGCFIL